MNGQVNVTTIEVEGTIYTMTRPGYYYKKVDGKQTRIPKDEWEINFAKAEKARLEAEADKKTEEAFNGKEKAKKAAKKVSKNAFFTSPSTGVTLTEKQVSFLTEMMGDDFYEHGLDSTLWIDVLCETISGTFSPMAVGAMISTLKEKDLIYVAQDKVNGKRCKFFGFTDLGKQVAQEVGLK